ncbi:class I SAM-dependent methyltransferase [Kibdelosporangium persicum]|uniref:Demethylrebeccamycin-D-glucose O-methyltransferase n=1 Tax=Kibdelosporangium persicum TaxID=2698649 RepID=A0ABX2EZ47_9PSEU|nr:class I SAM-dependent methyltransferase [Kibdelosporangium persicum]NRN64055.1 Demethylrebeccamycin-D-glucose O-methyltransferase [Kibdelosporangium persicum]
MSKELDRVRDAWETLGTSDPYWAVLTEHEFHGGEAKTRFFDSGRAEIRKLLDVLDKHRRPYGDAAVDFGCGVGRLSYALAEHFKHVTGVDVARSMIEEARASNPFPDRVRFVHNDAATLPFDDDSVDLVISVITLQHIRPALSLRYMLEMARIVRPGGHLLFQVPSHIPAVRPIPPWHSKAELHVLEAPSTLEVGENSYIRVGVTNASDGEWPSGQLLNAGNHWRRNGLMAVQDDGRDSVRCPLKPGEHTEALIRIKAPAEPGSYELEVDVVQESVAWWADRGSQTVRVPVEVRAAAPAVEAPSPADTPEPAAAPATIGAMEMHGVRKDLVCALFEQIGCTVLEATPDDRAGSDWVSYFYAIEVGEYRVDINHGL